MMKKELSKDNKGIDFFNTLKHPILYLVIISIVMITLLFPFIDILLARDFKKDIDLKIWKVKQGEEFTVVYTHSVEKSPVTETYKVDGKKIILLETTFKSFGAGLPATTPYKFEIADGIFRIYDIDEKMETVMYRTGAEIANHEILIGGDSYSFLSFSEKRTAVEFSIKKINFLKYVLNKLI